MNYLILLTIVLGVTIQQICQKSYSLKRSGGAYTFTAATVFFAAIFFIATSGGDFSISREALWYSLVFALTYGVGTIFNFFAIATGPLSITNLIIQYALIVPALYGILVLNEPVDVLLVVGIVLLIISLFLVNIEKKGIKKKITLKWGLFALLAFLGNGGCSTVQKMQQLSCDGMYKNQFMIVALLIVVMVLLTFALKKEKSDFVPTLKNGFWQYAVCGLANGLVNLLVIILATRMPVSLMFPVVSAGGTVVTAIVSVVFYKEKLSVCQWIGLVLGTAAIIVLNM